jgi:hypothetical protein
MGLLPAGLGHISEAATAAISRLPGLLTAVVGAGGVG